MVKCNWILMISLSVIDDKWSDKCMSMEDRRMIERRTSSSINRSFYYFYQSFSNYLIEVINQMWRVVLNMNCHLKCLSNRCSGFSFLPSVEYTWTCHWTNKEENHGYVITLLGTYASNQAIEREKLAMMMRRKSHYHLVHCFLFFL